MPIFKAKNEKFFEKWSANMAYVLGYFLADGCITVNPRGSHYLDFFSIDRELIEQIKTALSSEHKLKKRHRKGGFIAYRLQIGSKKMCEDLNRLGITVRKSGKETIPPVPRKYLPHFIRGYFDGDGCVSYGEYKRKDRRTLNRILFGRFTCSNRGFLVGLKLLLKKEAGLRGGSICLGKGAWHLSYCTKDALRLFEFMYGEEDILKLDRKYFEFLCAIYRIERHRVDSDDILIPLTYGAVDQLVRSHPCHG